MYSKVNPADAPIMTLALTSDTLPLTKVEDLADTMLAQKISQLSGVGLVSIAGGQKPAVRIQANPTALANYGLSLEDLRTALGTANVDQAKGSLNGARQAYTIGANDQLLSSADYDNVIIAYRNGSPVRLSDVANAVDSAENLYQAAWMGTAAKAATKEPDGQEQPAQPITLKPAVIVNIQRQPGANIIGVVDEVQRLLPQLRNSLPASVKLDVLTDRTNTIRASVKDVEFELVLTIALVVMVIFLFLRSIRATVIPAVAVPLSIVGTFGVMYLLGYSLNNLSLMALTISTGFVVDDAIVMIENIARYLEEGDSPLDAALKGSEQIGFTIVSLTVSLIAVLIPLLFMGDIVGRLFREFAVTLAVTILVSAFVSLTLTPMMSAKLLKHKPESEQGWFYRKSEEFFEYVIAKYAVGVRLVLRHQTTDAAGDAGYVHPDGVSVHDRAQGLLPGAGHGRAAGDHRRRRRRSALTAMSDRQQDAGEGHPAGSGCGERIVVHRHRRHEHDAEQRAHPDQSEGPGAAHDDGVRGDSRLEPKVAQVDGIQCFLQPLQDLTVEDRVSRTQYQYSVEDASAAELAVWTDRLVEKLKQIPILTDVASDQQLSGLDANLVIDRDTAARLGITPQNIDDTLDDAFGQRQVSTIFTQQNQYHVVLEVAPRYQRTPSSLDSIYVKSSNGTQVPLSTFTHFDAQQTPLAINHQGQFPVVTISFNLAPGKSIGDAVDAVNKAKAELNMPSERERQVPGLGGCV